MVNLTVGQQITINTAVWDFCSPPNAIYINRVEINTVPPADPYVQCLIVSGIEVTFKLVTAGSAKCHQCNPDLYYSTLGTARSNSIGIATLTYTVTQDALNAYLDAVSKGNSISIMACITDPKGQPILQHDCTEALMIRPLPTPTHYIALSMGFVPDAAAEYFSGYITDISNLLMTKLTPFPSPWEYIKTTYDRASNTFNIYLYLPPASMSLMSPGFIDDLKNWLEVYGPWIIGAIFVIIGFVIIALAPVGAVLFLTIGLLDVVAGVVLLMYKVYTYPDNLPVAQNTATNAQIELNIDNNAIKGKEVLDDAGNKSGKSQADCTTQLEGYRDTYLTSVLNSYAEKYAKYADFVTALQSEKTAFLSAANSIISEFKTKPYSVDVCNTYYTQLDSAVAASKVRVNELVSRYIIPDKPYEVCNINAVQFLKNHETPMECKGLTTDIIEIKVVASVGAVSVGKNLTVNCEWVNPDGSISDNWSPLKTITSSGTYDFIVPVLLRGAGTYTIRNSMVRNDNTNEIICSAKVGTGGCSTMSITSPPAATGSISCLSDPTNAAIDLDGVDLNKFTTPAGTLLTNISTGSHAVTFRYSGYNNCTVQVNVTAGGTVTANCKMAPVSTAGKLNLTSTPPGAGVYINGEYIGITPINNYSMAAGAYNLKLTLSGYNDYTTTFTIKTGEATSVSATLNPVAKPGAGVGAGTILGLGLLGAGVLGAIIYASRDTSPPAAGEYPKYPPASR